MKNMIPSKFHWWKILAYLLASALFMSIDYSYGEAIDVRINIFALFLLISFFIIFAKIILELFLIYIAAYFAKCRTMEIPALVKIYLSACFIGFCGINCGIVIQLLLFHSSNDLFQTVWLFGVHSIMYYDIYRKTSCLHPTRVVKCVMIGYFGLYFVMQLYSISQLIGL